MQTSQTRIIFDHLLNILFSPQMAEQKPGGGEREQASHEQHQGGRERERHAWPTRQLRARARRCADLPCLPAEPGRPA